MKSHVMFDTNLYKGMQFQEQRILDINEYVNLTKILNIYTKKTHSSSVFKFLIKGQCYRHIWNAIHTCTLNKMPT